MRRTIATGRRSTVHLNAAERKVISVVDHKTWIETKAYPTVRLRMVMTTRVSDALDFPEAHVYNSERKEGRKIRKRLSQRAVPTEGLRFLKCIDHAKFFSSKTLTEWNILTAVINKKEVKLIVQKWQSRV